jgi:hypothetical protein
MVAEEVAFRAIGALHLLALHAIFVVRIARAIVVELTLP